MSIGGVALNHFSATTHPDTASVPESCKHHAMFHSFLYDDRKTYSKTTSVHNKHIIGF